MRDFCVGIPTVSPRVPINDCIAAVLASTAKPKRIVVIDNREGWEPFEHWACEVVRPSRNLGIAASWNLLIKLIHPLSAIILNDDCIVGPTVLEEMLNEEGELFSGYGMGCFRIEESCVKRVGWFDENFYPGYYEDTDYRIRCILSCADHRGWAMDDHGKLLVPRDIRHGKDHLSGNNYQGWPPEKIKWFYERLEANKQYFMRKWGGLPEQTTFKIPFDCADRDWEGRYINMSHKGDQP